MRQGYNKGTMTDRTGMIQEQQKQANLIAVLFTFALIVLTGIFFDFYYNLNDDMLMKDIVSGLYTGMPDGHNIQMLYPLSFLLSIPYHFTRVVSWYGIFFFLSNYGCIFLVVRRIVYRSRSRLSIIGLAALGSFFLGAFFLWDLIFVQYTVSSAILGSTAIFLFYTNETSKQFMTPLEFVRSNLPSILLVILAFCVRSEMLLLLTPFIGVVGIVKWSEEERPLTLLNFKKYFSVIGLMAAGMLFGFIINYAAYSSQEWKEFNSFFDQRTQLYDFQKIPPYSGNEDFYESLGVRESQQKLLENYNFGLDETIDASMMGEVASYAASIRTLSIQQRITEAVKGYYRLLIKEWKLPEWDLLIFGLYVLGFIAAVVYRKYRKLFAYLMLFFVRSVIWIYLIYGERLPDRLTHSVYLAEALILSAFLIMTTTQKDQERSKVRKAFQYIMFLIIAFICLLNLRPGIGNINSEIERRESINPEYESLKEYCAEHETSYYFLDVYSIVAYTEKIFETNTILIKNYDYMGGWGCKSPLYYDKLKLFGMNTMSDAFIKQDHIYVISKAERDIHWLEAYFNDSGKPVTIVQTDQIQVGTQNIFSVYQIEGASKSDDGE